jgi:serine protease AprX
MLLKAPRSIGTLVLVTATVALAVGSAGAQPIDRVSPPKLDVALSRSVQNGESGFRQVIIRATPDGLPAATAALHGRGYAVKRVHPLINGLEANIPVAALAGLSRLPFVASISLDAVVTAEQTAASTYTAPSTYTLRATLGLPGPTGTGSSTQLGSHIGIAIIDSGVAAVPDFGDRIRGFYDFTQGGRADTPSDAYGHGTHVAGLIAGNGALSEKRYRGVAPKARLFALKVLDHNGAGKTSDVISAISFAIENKTRLGIDIINLSLGHPIYEPAETDPLVQAVEAAARAGMVVVASAGNHGTAPGSDTPGYAGILSPANAPSAIAVGAVKTFDTTIRSDDRIAAYSSRGPSWYDGFAKPDIVAPGHALVSTAAPASTLFSNNPALRVGDAYLRLSGTSMAAAVVSGTAALVLEAQRIAFPGGPSLTPNAVKAILQFTSFRMQDDLALDYDGLTQGAGVVNPAGAIDLASCLDTSVPASSWWLTTAVNPSTTIDGEVISWAEDIVWGNTAGTGPVVYIKELAWAEDIVWGHDIVWGSDIVWGNDIVWGSDIVWGNNIVWGDSLIGVLEGTTTVWGMVAEDPALTVWAGLDPAAIWSGSILTSLGF